jgi:Phospholipase_D-nuclease N-terminal
MLLAVVLFGLVTVGFVVPCLIDVAVTPSAEMRSLSKPAWVLLIVFFSVFGATAWLAAGRPDRRRRMRLLPRYLEDAPSIGQQDALRRHPAGRAMEPGADAGVGPAAHDADTMARWPVGPDDDPEFMAELDRRLHGGNGA